MRRGAEGWARKAALQVANHPEVQLDTIDGEAAVTLAVAGLSATFVPSVGMAGTSIRHDGDDVVHLGSGLGRVKDGHTAGIPLLHPWANRLASKRYRAAGVTVDLDEVPAGVWHGDPNGLPIHGTFLGRPRWDVLRVAADAKAAALVARVDAADHPDLFAAFPFPHTVEVEVRVEPILPPPRSRSAPRARVVVATTLRATGRRRVPVSFGWHPYFTLPGVKRADAVVGLPPRDHLELDERGLPTGASVREPAFHEKLGKRTFDDAYRFGRDRRLALEGPDRVVAIELDRNYPWGQVYAPTPASPSDWFVCLEPMTAPVDALSNDACPIVAPGGQFTARFSVTVAAR